MCSDLITFCGLLTALYRSLLFASSWHITVFSLAGPAVLTRLLYLGGGREVGEVSECCMALLRNLISHNYAIGNSRNIVLRLGKP